VADLKRKGDLAELAVATDLVRRGYRVAFPFGEDWDADLLVLYPDGIARVQVKYVTPRGDVLVVSGRSQSLTNGRVRTTKVYTAETVDVLAAYDARSGRCYYVPASELGKKVHHLRLGAARNNQRSGVRMAADYAAPPFPPATLNPPPGAWC
jgi:hypothetical protein